MEGLRKAPDRDTCKTKQRYEPEPVQLLLPRFSACKEHRIKDRKRRECHIDTSFPLSSFHTYLGAGSIWSVRAAESCFGTASAALICSGIARAGQGHRKGRAFPNGAVHRDGSSMMFDDLGYNVEPHAQARNRFPLGISDPIEPFKNFVAQFSRDAQAMIADTDRDRIVGGGEIHLDGLGIGSILDRIAEQVGKDLYEPASIPDQAGSYCSPHHNGMARTSALH